MKLLLQGAGHRTRKWIHLVTEVTRTKFKDLTILTGPCTFVEPFHRFIFQSSSALISEGAGEQQQVVESWFSRLQRFSCSPNLHDSAFFFDNVIAANLHYLVGSKFSHQRLITTCTAFFVENGRQFVFVSCQLESWPLEGRPGEKVGKICLVFTKTKLSVC